MRAGEDEGHAVQVLTGQTGMTLEGLLDIAYDPYLPGFEKLIPGLVQAYDESGTEYPELAEAIEVQKNYKVKIVSSLSGFLIKDII